MTRSARKSEPKRSTAPGKAPEAAAFEAMLLSHVNDAVIGADADFRITYWGEGAERMYGFTAAEALGKTTLDLLRPTYAPGEREKLIENLTAQGRSTASIHTKHKDGSPVIAEIAMTRLMDEQGRPAGFIVVYRDVTDRFRARQELQEMNERLRGVLNATRESIWEFSPEGVVLLANRVALERFGRTAEEVIGRHFGEILSPELAQSRLAKLREVVETGRPVEFEDVRAGMYFRHSFFPVMAPDGSVSSVACFSRDITNSRKAEAELYESRKKYRDLMETTSDFIWETDARGRYTYCSPQMKTLWGMEPEGMIGKTPFDVMPADLQGPAIEQFAELARSPRPFALESVAIVPGGRLISIETSGIPFFGDDGRLLGFRGITRDITDRKRAEEGLRESEKMAGALIKHAATAIYEIDFRGPRFSSVNEAMCRILGYTRQELLAMDPGDLLEDESRTRFAERMRRQFAGEGLPDVVEYRVRKKDGTFVSAILNVSINPLEPHRVLVIAHDITARKRMEEEVARAQAQAELLSMTARRLLESEAPQAVIDELCRGVLEHLDCQVFFNFLVDKAAGKLRLNACGGIPEADIQNLRWLDYGAAVCGYVAQNAVRVVAEEIGVRPDPRTDLAARYGVKAYACHPLMAGGEVLGTLSFGARNRDRFSPDDLSLMKTVAEQVSVAIERTQSRQALHERGLELQRLTESLEQRVRERTAELAAANERLKAEVDERVRLVAAVEEADEGVVIMDDTGRIHYVNPALARLTGRDRNALLAMTYSELLEAGKEDGGPWPGIRTSIERSQVWRGRFSRTRAGGDTLELEATVSPIHDPAGRVMNYLAVERDVTREALLQRHLRQVQKLEALGTLAGGIAHDFNNILNPIFINTELLLLEPSLDPASRRYLEITLKAAERGRDLVKQIIAFSRQKEKERRPSKVGPVIGDVVKLLRVSLPSTIEIRTSVADETGVVLGDPVQLHQILMNLCNNAAYAMRDTGGVMDIRLDETDVGDDLAAVVPGLRSGPYLRLTVTDTGSGMTPAVRERIFDPFFTTKRPGEGAGMGLPVVDGIVRDYGGAIQVVTGEGRGSTFMVYLPRALRSAPDDVTGPESLPRGTERVLLIDDEEVQVRSIRNMLQTLGYDVTGLTNGQEALDLFRTDPRAFDLVITDQTMPQLTGVKIADEILNVRPDVPVILCTGFSEVVDAKGARIRGIREFLMKPYSIREMAEAVRRALTGAPPAK